MTNPLDRDDRWLLPDGVDEVLPPRARALEGLRQRLLECYHAWGYDLVMPPAIEYLDALLTGAAHDLELQTFKLTDQISGRLMGVRADMTPQAARIDAHQLRRDCPVRLCYTGTVLQTRAEGPGTLRNPLQVGAELYGHAGVESDVEIIALMLESLHIAGISTPHLDLGHVGIFRGLAQAAQLSPLLETRLWDALQRKAVADIEALLEEFDVAAADREHFTALAELSGGVEVLDRAGERLAGAAAPVHRAIRELWSIAGALERRAPEVPLHFDLAELRGYRYHTGVVFAAFVPNHGEEVARGGRYDEIGAVFGRPRPATGFSADLKTLFALGDTAVAPAAAIAAPWRDDAALLTTVRRLRGAGERVLWVLPGHERELVDMGCDRQLTQNEGRWEVAPL
jgi:ATP phosphoribosyltransferase regulatory subunit